LQYRREATTMEDLAQVPSLQVVATEVADIKQLLLQLLEAQKETDRRYQELEQRLDAGAVHTSNSADTLPVEGSQVPPTTNSEKPAKRAEEPLKLAATPPQTVPPELLSEQFYTAVKHEVRQELQSLWSESYAVGAGQPDTRLQEVVDQEGSDGERSARERAREHQASVPRPPMPIRLTSHDAASRGLTAVVIGDQAPFTHRLRVFDVKHVYVFLRHVEEYQQAYGVQVQLVSFMDQSILDAILAVQEHVMDLPAQVMHWTPDQLRVAMCRYFASFHYLPQDLCEVAREVVTFPRVKSTGVATAAKLAQNQLCQVPVYAASLRRFKIFVETYRLLVRGWPRERNPQWGEVPHRLNEVLTLTLKDNAPEAYRMIREELFRYRKESITVLLNALPDLCGTAINELNSAHEVQVKLQDRPSLAMPRFKGEDRGWLKAPKSSAEQKGANLIATKTKPLNAIQVTEAGDLSAEPEDSETETWSEVGDVQAAEQEPGQPSELEDEGLNEIDVRNLQVRDRALEACHGHFFGVGGCVYAAKGKACPFSHDPVVGQRAIDAAVARLKKIRDTK
jgi:hypothetical protein